MNKMLAFLLLCASASAGAQAVYGVGVESTYLEGIQLNNCERLRVGVMSGGWTLSTTYLPFNNQCEGIKGRIKFKTDQKSITLGRMLYQDCGGRFCKQVGLSVSDVRDKPLNDHYTQLHAVGSVLDIKTGLAMFVSVGEKEGKFTSTVGIYGTIGSK